MATPGSFVAGVPLTAAEMNLLPGGCLGAHSLTTAFVTVSTHTTYQDEGLTKTVAEVAGRRIRITLGVAPYVSGGSNGVVYALLRGAVVIHEWFVPSDAINSSLPHMMTLTHTEVVASSAGASVFKVQLKANPGNTAVNSYAAAASPRQLIIEDIGI